MKVWDIKRSVFSVGDFISWAKSEELELSPSFQRRPVWRKKAKSYFIDTIVRGLPVPIVFLRERTDIERVATVREVVDGQQRLRTLIAFVDPSLVPHYSDEDDFQLLKIHNAELAGLAFKQLPDAVRHQILSYQLSVHVLPSETDDADVLRIFARMNATGTKLNDQELRNAEYHGEFFNSVYEASLSQLDRWRAWGVFTEYNIARMDEAELTSELFIQILSGVTGKTKGSIDRYYEDNEDIFLSKNVVKDRFSFVFDEIERTLGNKIRNSPFSKRTLFYVLFSVYYDLAFGLGTNLKKSKGKKITEDAAIKLQRAAARINKGVAPKNVLDAAARRTTHKANREILANYFLNSV